MLLNRQVPVYVFEKTEKASDYVGTEVDWVYTKTLLATVQPAEIRVENSAFGVRTASALRLYCAPDAEIDEQCALSRADCITPTHTVCAVQSFKRFKAVTAEAMPT